MNILATQYSLDNKSLDIYVAGCSGNPHCSNCHNKETWSFNQGDEYNEKYYKKIKNKILEFDSLVDNIMIFGGEPLDQDINKLTHMLLDLKYLNKKIWVFTRYDIKEVPKEIKILCDYIKCGRYIPELTVDNNIQHNITLATSNQIIYKKGVNY